MASDPQPAAPVPPESSTQPAPANAADAAADADEEPAVPAPAGGEERKAAAALSALDAPATDDRAGAPRSEADQKALGEAMSRLEIAAGGSAAAAAKSDGGKKEAEVRKKVKVDQADVGLLVEELELTKVKATELLKTHDGDAVKAMRAFMQPVA